MGNRAKFRYLNYDQAHKFVEKAGDNTFWDGWDIVIFTPRRGAVMSAKGVYRNGQWGTQTRTSCDNRGIWKVRDMSARTS